MDRFQAGEYYEWSKLAGHFVVVHVVRGTLAALLHVYLERDAGSDETYLVLDMLVVDERFQGRGIGRVMVEIGDDIADQLSISERRLEALTESLVGLYAKFGFVRYGPPRSYPGWANPVYPMRKRVG
jgi:GNAT superfamily N-acetyltransferase